VRQLRESFVNHAVIHKELLDADSILFKMMTDPVLHRSADELGVDDELENEDDLEQLADRSPRGSGFSKGKPRASPASTASSAYAVSRSGQSDGKVFEQKLDPKRIEKFVNEIADKLNIPMPDMNLGEGGTMGTVHINQNSVSLPHLVQGVDDGEDENQINSSKGDASLLSQHTKELLDNFLLRNNP